MNYLDNFGGICQPTGNYCADHCGSRIFSLNIIMFTRFFAAIALVLFAGVVQAASVLTTQGATGVVVNGKTYNVDFEDGTCIALFDGCDEPSDFTFQTESDAADAMTALSALIDATPAIDADPRVDGCTDPILCISILAYLDFPADKFLGRSLWNGPLPTVGDALHSFLEARGYDTSSETGYNFVIWTEVPAVPLPASAPLLIAGMAGLAALGRRRKRKAA